MGDYFIKDGFLLDQAYLRYKPVNDLTIWAGRIPNPWFYTDLIWANDLNFEGVAGNYTRDICSRPDRLRYRRSFSSPGNNAE